MQLFNRDQTGDGVQHCRQTGTGSGVGQTNFSEKEWSWSQKIQTPIPFVSNLKVLRFKLKSS